jgi:hypothetical protein
MVASIFGALSSRVFAAVLAAAALVGSVACWVVSSLEPRRWAQRDRIPDWVDPPPGSKGAQAVCSDADH